MINASKKLTTISRIKLKYVSSFITILFDTENSVWCEVNSSVAEIAQLGERQTEDLKVPGSNPENSLAWVLNNPGSRHSFFFLILVLKNKPFIQSILQLCDCFQDTFYFLLE